MGKPLEERFWAKVQKTETCWLWTASVNSMGYGKLSAGPPRGRTELASRLSWVMHYGAIPEGAFVLHHCDTPRCVRPDHLFLGDAAANSHDMWAKGRARFPTRLPTLAEHSRGETHGPAKLTEAQVTEIRQRYKRAMGHRDLAKRADGGSAMAKEYGVTSQTIYAILNRKTWTHLP
jgi:hypothetical protein